MKLINNKEKLIFIVSKKYDQELEKYLKIHGKGEYLQFYLPAGFNIINDNEIEFIEVDDINDLESIEIGIDINKLSKEDKNKLYIETIKNVAISLVEEHINDLIQEESNLNLNQLNKKS